MNSEIIKEIYKGFTEVPKRISSKYFYDQKGSFLFNEICRLDEYYLTRTEINILNRNIDEIINTIGKNTLLVELGSGSSVKTKILLNKINSPAAYVCIDIAEEELSRASKELIEIFPQIDIVPLNLDFMNLTRIPYYKNYDTVTYFFPGSTIGNFSPNEAREFFLKIRNAMPGKTGLLIGVDLVKEKSIISKAYNDSKGITASFNLNILNNINSLTGSNFNLEGFEHEAFFNEEDSRVEMHLKSKFDQCVNLNRKSIEIRKGEKILTEYSYKYSNDSFNEIVEGSFMVKKRWTDLEEFFAVYYCEGI